MSRLVGAWLLLGLSLGAPRMGEGREGPGSAGMLQPGAAESDAKVGREVRGGGGVRGNDNGDRGATRSAGSEGSRGTGSVVGGRGCSF